MSKHRALVIDDEPDICELLTLTLGRMGIETESVLDLSSGKEKLKSTNFDICLTDMRLPDGDGLELVKWMQEHAPAVPVAVITAHGNVETAVNALKLGAFDFLSKPLDLKHLRNIIESALKLNTPDPAKGSSLLGASPAMHELRDLVEKVARSQAPVHICGESGTGKELVAKMIHKSSSRGDGPFVPVNCGAIPSELMESEFFGHKKGSFTGADADKLGLIQSADGGTLFLDEIADLPLAMQVKLLRVIQEKSIRPVGESREKPVNARLLTATHKNLRKLVADGEFREDLYYRINVIEISVPALRERSDDALELTEHILSRLGTKVTLNDSAKNALLRYTFPGNVRELENVLERAVTLCTSGVISEADLNLQQESAAATGGSGKLGDHIEDVERQAIVDALEKTRYNKTAAAKLLGLSFRQLRYRIDKLDIK